ncbi:MAG: hypothetical protein R3281_18715 [Balneolaceae bacterium]|nr:hypothetical protein [Balneolaceae bacterium]
MDGEQSFCREEVNGTGCRGELKNLSTRKWRGRQPGGNVGSWFVGNPPVLQLRVYRFDYHNIYFFVYYRSMRKEILTKKLQIGDFGGTSGKVRRTIFAGKDGDTPHRRPGKVEERA